MADQLVYTHEALMRDHDFVAPHMVGSIRLHGGFNSDGSYQPPRALVREAAFDAWERQLVRRGGSLLDADASLLSGQRVPNVEQHKVLLAAGLGETMWNALTITGKIEARGRLLAEIDFPDLQPSIVDDISTMAIGHLNKGLLVAHGIDEGGEPENGIGGHDAMWFVARDLVFGEGAYPDVEPPEQIGRPAVAERLVPEVPPEIESLISFLANLLIIEFRAENGFADTQAVFAADWLFDAPAENAALASQLIERIRTDELIHVRSLRLYLGELRTVEFRTVDGGTITGATIIDRFWDGLVHWATVEQPKLVAERDAEVLAMRIEQHADPELLKDQFAAAG